MLTLTFKTISVYFVLILAMRLMGKRQLGELQTSEFIVAVMLSEIATSPITQPGYPFSHAIISISALVLLEFLISAILIRSNRLKRLFYGKPAILIRKGEVDIAAMRKNRIELDELLSEIRQKGFPTISQVNYAILEENGKLSVFPKAEYAPASPRDLSLKVSEDGIAHLLILDGTVLERNLSTVGWNRQRLDCELSKRSTQLSDVFLLTVDDGKHIILIKKNKK